MIAERQKELSISTINAPQTTVPKMDTRKQSSSISPSATVSPSEDFSTVSTADSKEPEMKFSTSHRHHHHQHQQTTHPSEQASHKRQHQPQRQSQHLPPHFHQPHPPPLRSEAGDDDAHHVENSESSAAELNNKRKLFSLLSDAGAVAGVGSCAATATPSAPSDTFDYDADVDDDSGAGGSSMPVQEPLRKMQKLSSERQYIYEIFQPWALKTYGDQAKTKTITLRKKVRILKALEGKEHSRPDSSKFRYWVKSKAFTTKRPDSFEDVLSSRTQSSSVLKPLSDNPKEVDLYVASTSKDFGHRTFRKVAVVEEFFDIIYNVHMELGGRSGMHAGQKRTYRFISETFAFLPREAVTRFLSTCPECKKNLRPTSPATSSHNEEPANESSSEVEVLNYSSSHTESSVEGAATKVAASNLMDMKQESSEELAKSSSVVSASAPCDSDPISTQSTSSGGRDLPKIRINPQFQRCPSPEPTQQQQQQSSLQLSHISFDFNALKSRDGLLQYYELMRRLYSGQSSQGILQSNRCAPATLSKTKDKEESHQVIKSNDDDTQPDAESVQLTTPSRKSATTHHQTCAIDLSKNLLFRSVTSHKRPQLKIPQVLAPTLPPLDLNELKPITSTYLQLTRSMGLSDSDALRFDDLVSEDFKYSL